MIGCTVAMKLNTALHAPCTHLSCELQATRPFSRILNIAHLLSNLAEAQDTQSPSNQFCVVFPNSLFLTDLVPHCPGPVATSCLDQFVSTNSLSSENQKSSAWLFIITNLYTHIYTHSHHIYGRFDT